MKRIFVAGFTATTILSAGLALAQSAPPMVVRATIDAVNGNVLSLTDRDGKALTVTLAPDAKIAEILPSSLADVKPGSFVGTAAMPLPNGDLRAMELQVFPESMRGVGEGTRAWNLAPKSSMTNGTVGKLSHGEGTVGNVSGSGDITLTVNYGNGTKTVLVPQTVPVVTYAPGTTADLKPGAHVLLFAIKAADGSLSSPRVTVGVNGLTPPM